MGNYTSTTFLGQAEDAHSVVSWAQRELSKVQQAFQDKVLQVGGVSNVPPAKPRDGAIALADGVHWNPGSGKGFYGNYGASWRVLLPQQNGAAGYTISLNASPNAAPQASAVLQLILADAASGGLEVDGYGGDPNVIGRKALGTQASPSAVTTDNNLLFIGGIGFDSSLAFSGNAAAMYLRAAEAWTSTHHGTYIGLATTPIGSTVRGEGARVNPSGGVSIGSTVDPGAGNLSFTGIITGANSPYTAWTSYTPTVTAASGTFTTVSATGRFKQVGKTVFFTISIVITTNGTAAGSVIATLPVSIDASLPSVTAIGQEINNTGKAVNAFLSSGGNQAFCKFYDNSYPGSNGAGIIVNGVYEVL